MPAVCVACGNESVSLVEYEQDHIPFITPVFVSFRSTKVSVPYCDSCAVNFRRRFRVLERTRILICVVLLAGAALALLPDLLEIRRPFEHSVATGIIVGAVGLVCLLLSIVLKPLLYDVFFNISGTGLQMKGGSSAFRHAVIEANRGNATAC